MPKPSRRLFTLIFSLNLLCTLASGDLSLSQIVRDGTVGPAVGSVVEPTGPNFQIDSTLGRIEGANLFHSFSDFNVQTLADGTVESATFTNSLPLPIQNILSRVTGGDPSTINGTLASTIENAALFLLNPNGVVFGPNASLDLKGSFHVSTADVLRFDNGQAFYMDASLDGSMDSIIKMPAITEFGFFGDPTSEVGGPASLVFSHNAPAPITVTPSTTDNPSVAVFGGEFLSLIGGDINLNNKVFSAPNGQVSLVSVASSGELVLDPVDPPLEGFQDLGTITLSNDAFVRTSGEFTSGRILIRGKDLIIDNSTIFANSFGVFSGGQINVVVDGDVKISNQGRFGAQANNEGSGADILIGADRLIMDTESRIVTGTKRVFDESDFIGDAGDISVHVRELNLSNGANIRSITEQSDGSAGDIFLTATEKVMLSGDIFTRILSQTEFSQGDAGDIHVSTPTLIMNGGQFGSRTFFATGRAGDIFFGVGQITMANEATISADSLRSLGVAGDIFIYADQEILVTENSSIISQTNGIPNAGNIIIVTPSLRIQQSGEIGVRTFSSGDSGSIRIEVDDLTLATGGTISNNVLFMVEGSSFVPATGDADVINVIAQDSIRISDSSAFAPAGIFSETFGIAMGDSF